MSTRRQKFVAAKSLRVVALALGVIATARSASATPILSEFGGDTARGTFRRDGEIGTVSFLEVLAVAIGDHTVKKAFSIAGTVPELGIFFDGTVKATKDPVLVALGLPPGTTFSGTGTRSAMKQSRSAYGVTSAALSSVGQILAPEPGSLALLGTGLVVLAHTVRRRYRRGRESSSRKG